MQVGDIYFVLDGHHRLSVARTIGQQIIETEVTVWQVSGLLPWEKPAAVSAQEQSGRHDRALQGKARWFGEWILVGLRGLVPAAQKT